MQIEGFGLTVDLPAGWYGRIYTNTEGSDAPRSSIFQAASVPIPDSDDDILTATSQLIGPDGAMIMLFESPYYPSFNGQFEAVSGPPTLRPADAQAGWEGMNPLQSIFVRRMVINSRYFQLRVVFGSQPDFNALGSVNGTLSTMAIGAPVPA
jgi:hypothetical protein